jgi:hypothetical protein
MSFQTPFEQLQLSNSRSLEKSSLAQRLEFWELAERVGFEPLMRSQNLQLAESPLPELPFLPQLPSGIAHHCPPTVQLERLAA